MVARQQGSRRVFVCDDSYGYPLLVRTWLDEAAGVELAGIATTATELMSQLTRARAHVLLLDLMLPEGLVGPGLVDEVRELSPGVRVVLSSALPEHILRAESTRTGADAACSKLASREQLLAVIEA